MRSMTPAVTRISVLAFAVALCQIVGCGGGDDAAESSVASTDNGAASAPVAPAADSGMASGGGGGAAAGHGGDDQGDMGGGAGGMEMMAQGGGGDSNAAAAMMMAGGGSGDGAYDSGSEMDAGMIDYGNEGGYPGMEGMDGSGGYGSGGYGGGGGQGGRPNDVTQWTDEQILTAVDDKDARVVQAIEMKAKNAPGDPAFVLLMDQVLAKTEVSGGGFPGGSGGVPGSAGFPAGPRPQRGPGGKPPVPPGGAFLDDIYRQPGADGLFLPQRGISTLEAMIGESLLAYAPQAAQGTRNAAGRLQGASQDAAAGMMMQAPPGSDPAMLEGAPGGAMMEDAPGGGMEGAPPGAMMQSGMGMDGGYGTEGYGAGGYGSGGQTAAQGSLQDEELVKAVIRGLVINNSPQAWSTIQALVDGSRLTALPPQNAVEVAIREAFSSSTPNLEKAEQLLATAMQNAVGNPDQYASTFRLLASVGQRPSDYFLGLGVPQPPAPLSPPGQRGQQGMAGYGAAMGGADMGMAMGMGMEAGMGGNYESGYDPGMGMEMGMQGGPGMGGPGMGQPGMGGPPAAAGPPPQSIPVAEAALLPVARVLWAPSTAVRVAGWLNNASSADAAADVLAFASTVPSDEIRQSVFNLLSRSHDAGADGLISSGLFRHFARDPGMLSVLKALPRIRKKPDARNPQAVVPMDSWEIATEDVMLSLRDRLREMASNPDLAYDGRPLVRLYKDAVPESAIRIVAPTAAAESLGDAAPDTTTVYYTKTIVTPQNMKEMEKVAEHYKSRTKGTEHKDIPKGILWYDGVKTSTDGTIQTMDVVFEQVGARPQNGGGFGAGYGNPGGGGYEGGAPGGIQGGQGGNGTQYSIEVIVVVTKDPSKTTAAAAVTTAAP